MENKYTRSQGFFDPKWAEYGATTNYFNYGGGLNLRGYSGYLAPQLLTDGTKVNTYKGQTGAAVNAELEFDGIIKIKKQNWLTKSFKLTTYLFGPNAFCVILHLFLYSLVYSIFLGLYGGIVLGGVFS